MPSQFFGLSISGSGLRNANAALNTTANNISNTQTKGYSRQQVDSQAANALRTFATYGCAGAGVETLSIERVRDSFYDVKYWNNNANYGQYEIKSYYAKNIEDYFNDDGKSGFVTIFNQMKDVLEDITTNASSTTTKADFVAQVQKMTDFFNGMYGNLQELQKDINLEIKQCVDQINSISSQIATLNKQINVIELSGAKANDLRDQRDLLIDTLSEYVDVQVVETPIYDTNDPTRETGASRHVVKIGGGQILVDGNDYNELSCVARTNGERINQCDADGLYKIKWDNGNEFNLNNASLNGKLKGLYELRDGNNTSNFNGTVSGAGAVTTNADGSKTQEVKIKVSDEYLKDINGCSLSMTGGEITIANATYYYKDWSFDGTDTYTFTIDSDNSASKAIVNGASAKTQEAIKYQGIPYYMDQLNTFLRSFANKVNDILTQHDTEAEARNAYGEIGVQLFTAKKATTDEEFSRAELEAPDASGNDTGLGYYYMTAGNVCVNTELLRDADLLGTRRAVYTGDGTTTDTDDYNNVGVEQCDQLKEVISAMTKKSVYSFRNASANQMLELVLSDVALNASNANTYSDTFNGIKLAIDNQRTSISGVDEDEEAVNLVKYQNNYTLASKMIQTLTEIYDQLILNTGV